MKKYLAELTKDVEIDVPFESVDVQTGLKFDVYTTKTLLTKGVRVFKTKTRRDGWVELMNKDYGQGIARVVEA